MKICNTRIYGLSLPIAIVFCVLPLPLRGQDLPKVRVFSTGGTIQGAGANRDLISNYKAGQITPKQLLDDLPEARAVADLTCEEISSVGSGDINTRILLKLAKAVYDWLGQPGTAGAVITHGTATLEETAYFLNLPIHSDK